MPPEIVVDSVVHVPKGPEFAPQISRAMKLYTLVLPFGKGVFKAYEEREEEFIFPRSATIFFPSAKPNVTYGRRFTATHSGFEYREGQEDALRDLGEGLASAGQPFSGGILCAGCGKGKTIMAAKKIIESGISTCVLVHKEFLEDQWVVAFRDVLNSNIRVGRLRRDCIDTGNTHDVVIASTQSLTHEGRSYPKEFFESFGQIYCDEVHRYGANRWQRALWQFPAAVRVGLTATARRADGTWPVILENIGPVVSTLEADAIDNDVYLVALATPINEAAWSQPWRDKIQQRAAMLSVLAKHHGRNVTIANYLIKAIEKDRHILVISERRAQLDALAALLEKGHKVPHENIGFYVGGKKLPQLKVAAEKPVVMATFAMAAEALDIPSLDTLFLTSPKSDIVQSVGRLLREHKGNHKLITVDFIDATVQSLINVAYGRVRQYRQMGCNVIGDVPELSDERD